MSNPYLGEIRLFGFSRTPIGWQTCDGSLLSIAEYDALYVLLGTTYGGDGINTFAVPDLRGRVPIHQGQGPGLSPYVIGQKAGTEHVTLVGTQMPAHTHTMLATTNAATSRTPGTTLLPGAISGDTLYASDVAGATPIGMAPGSTSNVGGTQPHDNTMPTLTVQYCISLFGIFPTQS